MDPTNLPSSPGIEINGSRYRLTNAPGEKDVGLTTGRPASTRTSIASNAKRRRSMNVSQIIIATIGVLLYAFLLPDRSSHVYDLTAENAEKMENRLRTDWKPCGRVLSVRTQDPLGRSWDVSCSNGIVYQIIENSCKGCRPWEIIDVKL